MKFFAAAKGMQHVRKVLQGNTLGVWSSNGCWLASRGVMDRPTTSRPVSWIVQSFRVIGVGLFPVDDPKNTIGIWYYYYTDSVTLTSDATLNSVLMADAWIFWVLMIYLNTNTGGNFIIYFLPLWWLMMKENYTQYFVSNLTLFLA